MPWCLPVLACVALTRMQDEMGTVLAVRYGLIHFL